MPDAYDYRRAELDGMHFSQLVDRWVQNLHRGAGFKVQHFAAIKSQRRLARTCTWRCAPPSNAGSSGP